MSVINRMWWCYLFVLSLFLLDTALTQITQGIDSQAAKPTNGILGGNQPLEQQISDVKAQMLPSHWLSTEQLQKLKKKTKRGQIKQIMGIDFYNPKKFNLNELKRRYLIDETEQIFRQDMFDFASVQIQKVSYKYLDEIKKLATEHVKNFIKENTLYTDEKADAIFARNDFKNIMKKTCAAFQIQFADALTYLCEDLAAKSLYMVLQKAQYFSFYKLHNDHKIFSDLRLSIDGYVLDPTYTYNQETELILDSLAKIIQIQYKMTKQVEINKFVSELDIYLEKFDLNRISAKKDGRDMKIEEFYFDQNSYDSKPKRKKSQFIQ